MSDKKCKMCGAPARWRLDDEFFCGLCLCARYGIHEVPRPYICDQCGRLIEDVYFVDADDNAFCSRECALAYCDVNAEKLED